MERHAPQGDEQAGDGQAAAIAALKPGDPEYRAYVGPPEQYDFMGATQFRLLCSLGLRARHAVLDLGCGSLRAGRLLIPYLDPGNYFGIEPNRWLIDEAIERQVGRDLIRIKRPSFDGNEAFDAGVFGRRFDFILAQSIFSHCGPDLVAKALPSMRGALEPGGLIAVTFVEGDRDEEQPGWVYPGCVTYTRDRIRRFADAAGLCTCAIPWFHPRQSWHLFALDRSRLPAPAEAALLRGVVLRDPEFAGSLR
ncbi:MAG: methyltransferase [Planctomycetaceae bacterium]